jgi:hypothetical protein
MTSLCAFEHPVILPLKLSEIHRERLRLHAQILRERSRSKPEEAKALLKVVKTFEDMLREDAMAATSSGSNPPSLSPAWAERDAAVTS